MKFVNKNYYEILDIDPKATDEDVKRAYRLVRSTWTPDSIAIYSLYTPDESEAISHKIEEAFQILAQPERRASYDRYLHHSSKLPPTLSSPVEFWDILHGYEPPDDEQELLDDVTDLLADPALEAEEKAEEVMLEATGGDARGIERLMSGDRSAFDEPEAIPDRDSASDRARAMSRGPTLASGGPTRGSHTASYSSAGGYGSNGSASGAHAGGHAGAHASSHPTSHGGGHASGPGNSHSGAQATAGRTSGGAGARGGQSAREPRPVVPAAPAAPPVKGVPTWNPTASPRTTGGGRSENPPSSTGENRRASSGSTPAFKHGVSTPRVAQIQPESEARGDSRSESRNESRSRTRNSGGDTDRNRRAPQATEPDPRQPVSSGWSRSYAGAMKPTRPLPDRPISPQMLADAEADHGLGGTFLRMVREYKGISINDIAERTKIQSTYLKYLEEERYSDLPPAVYVEGFVGQVARLLKLDVNHVVEGYMARYELPTNPPPDVDDF